MVSKVNPGIEEDAVAKGSKTSSRGCSACRLVKVLFCVVLLVGLALGTWFLLNFYKVGMEKFENYAQCTGLSQEVSPISKFSAREMCEISADASTKFQQGPDAGLAFLDKYAHRNITFSLAPRDRVPDYFIEDCIHGKEIVMEKMATVFSFAEGRFESVNTTIVSESAVGIDIAVFILGFETWVRLELSYKDQMITQFRSGCCEADTVILREPDCHTSTLS